MDKAGIVAGLENRAMDWTNTMKGIEALFHPRRILKEESGVGKGTKVEYIAIAFAICTSMYSKSHNQYSSKQPISYALGNTLTTLLPSKEKLIDNNCNSSQDRDESAVIPSGSFRADSSAIVYADTNKTAKIYESLANTDLRRICLKGKSTRWPMTISRLF